MCLSPVSVVTSVTVRTGHSGLSWFDSLWLRGSEPKQHSCITTRSCSPMYVLESENSRKPRLHAARFRLLPTSGLSSQSDTSSSSWSCHSACSGSNPSSHPAVAVLGGFPGIADPSLFSVVYKQPHSRHSAPRWPTSSLTSPGEWWQGQGKRRVSDYTI